jgi:acyl-CoA thioesterase
VVSPFDADTEVSAVGPGRWTGNVTDRWDIGVPNGGYVLCIALAAVRAAVQRPHPLSVTAHFLSPCDHGAAEIEVRVLKQGRSLATASAVLAQGGRPRLAVLATYGDLRSQNGPTLVTTTPPSLPPPEECGFVGDRPAAVIGVRPAIADRVEFRPSPASARALVARGAPAQLEGWIRLADGRDPDTDCLPLLVDAAPPAVFAVMETGWVPTLELTVHVRAVPAPGWLRAAIATRVVVDGLMEEECELWDAEGRLVAMSRQLARILPPQT